MSRRDRWAEPPLQPPLPPLPEALVWAFDAGVRARGAGVYFNGLCELIRQGPGIVAAQVFGSEVYRAQVRRTEDGVELACSCPFVADRGRPCKHLFGLLLAVADTVDLEDWLRPTSGRPGRVSVAMMADPDVDLGVGVGAVATVAPSRWRSLFGSLAIELVAESSSSPFILDAEALVYAIDADATVRVGRLQLGVLARLPGAGELGAPRPISLRSDEMALLAEPDATLLGELVGIGPPSDPWAGSNRYLGASESRHPLTFELSARAARSLLPRLAATGRLVLGRSRAPKWSTPLTWSDEPWALELRCEALDGVPTSYRLGSRLVAGGATRELADAWALVPGAVVAGDGWIAPCEAAPRAWLELLRREGQVAVPAADIEELIAAYHRLPGELPVLRLPAEIAVTHEMGMPRPRFKIEPPTVQSPWRSGPFEGQLLFRYGDAEVAASDPGRQVYDPSGRRVLRRDRAAELAAGQVLAATGARLVTAPRPPYQPIWQVARQQLTALVPELLAAGFEVIAEGRQVRRPATPRLAVRSGIDWFEVAGEVDFDGAVATLPALLAALAKKETTVLLDDGSRGLLPAAWLARHRLWLELGTPEAGGALRFAPGHAPLVGAGLDDDAEAAVDAGFRKLRERLREGTAEPSVRTPRGFRGSLRDYQRAGVGWLRFLASTGLGGCLADEMGLGKTVQLLAFLGARQRRAGTVASLVVAPRSLLFNWATEAARFTPKLVVRTHHGSGRGRAAVDLAGADLVLTTYDLLRRDTELLAGIPWDVVILDEAQAIKNESTVVAQAARQLRAQLRLAATGTPVENHLGELFSLFEFLNPGLLARSTLLRKSGGGLRRELPPADLERLARGLRPFVLRRTKREVAPELPARTEQTILCELEPAQRKVYDELRDFYRASLVARARQPGGLKRIQVQVLEALLRLRQAACHAGLLRRDREDAHSAKLDMLVPRLAELVEAGHKVLVFSQFTSFLALLRLRLEAQGMVYSYLDGATADRAAAVGRFTDDPGVPLFLISLKAGGLGLNLTAAEYVFLLDPWWNPAVEAQAIDRTHRIGQTQPVFAYRLIARDTVEERILELQARKRELADAILGARSESLAGSLVGPLAGLTVEDLDLLLS